MIENKTKSETAQASDADSPLALAKAKTNEAQKTIVDAGRLALGETRQSEANKDENTGSDDADRITPEANKQDNTDKKPTQEEKDRLDLSEAVLSARAKVADLASEQLVRADLDQAQSLAAYLFMQTAGKVIDSHFEAFTMRHALIYFERLGIRHPSDQKRIWMSARKIYREMKICDGEPMFMNGKWIQAARYHNELVSGRKRYYSWLNPFTPKYETLEPSENDGGAYIGPQPFNMWKAAALATLLGGTILTVKYVIFPAFSNLINGTTNLSVLKPPSPPITTGIEQSCCLNMNRVELQNCITTLEDTLSILRNGPRNNIANLCGRLVSESSMRPQLSVWQRVSEFVLPFVPFLK